MDFILWELSYAAGLRIIWADAVANGLTCKRVFYGETREGVRAKSGLREQFAGMKKSDR